MATVSTTRHDCPNGRDAPAAPPRDRERFRIDLSYDGSAYAGWQLQPDARTVQAVVEAALGALTGQAVRVHGSGRTDRGVHARQQVAHADLTTRIPPAALARALNARLPADIRVLGVRKVSARFDARRSARAKEYRYRIWNASLLPPELRLHHAHERQPLNVERMRRAAQAFCGTHDFSAFSANPRRDVPDAVRHIAAVSIHGRGARIEIRVIGDGFLYKMVRSMVGFLVRVGRGDEAETAVGTVLQSRRRTARVPTAPPQGLFLWRVSYRSAIIKGHARKNTAIASGRGFRSS